MSTQAPQQAAPTEAAPTTGAAQPTVVPPTAVPAAPSAPASADFFGVSTYGEVIHNEELRALAILGGVQMVRTSVNWNNVEKTKGEDKWGGVDSTLGPLLDNNLTPLVLVLNNAEWAANSPCGPVNDLPAFEQFVRELAARYQGGPDLGHV